MFDCLRGRKLDWDTPTNEQSVGGGEGTTKYLNIYTTFDSIGRSVYMRLYDNIGRPVHIHKVIIRIKIKKNGKHVGE